MARAEAAALSLTLLTAGGASAEGLDLSPEDRAAFGAEVRALLLDEPEIIGRLFGYMPASPGSAYDDAAAADAALLAAEAAALSDDPGDWTEGPRDGPTLVAFLPAVCGDCPALLADLRDVAARMNARLVVKDTAEPHPDAARFLTAVLDLHGPDAWLQARETLHAMEAPDRRDHLARVAETHGWPPDALVATMDAPTTRARQDRVSGLASRLGFDIAPSYVVGGIMVRGDVPPAVLERYLAP